MKTKLAIGGLILIVIALAASMVLGRGLAQEYSGQKWEYAMTLLFTNDSQRALTFTNDEDETKALEEKINALDKNEFGSFAILQIMGNNGWELVEQNENSDPEVIQFLFKRPVL